MSKKVETISFIASLASTGNTFSVDGQGASRVVFSVPESELPKAVKILLLKDKAFRVDINEVPKNQGGMDFTGKGLS